MIQRAIMSIIPIETMLLCKFNPKPMHEESVCTMLNKNGYSLIMMRWGSVSEFDQDQALTVTFNDNGLGVS